MFDCKSNRLCDRRRRNGELFLAPENGHSYVRICDGGKPVDGTALYALPGQDMVRLGAADETARIGGGSGFADSSAAFKLDALPKLLRVDPTSPAAESVARTLDALRVEVAHAELGGSLVAERLAEILVISAVRAFVATGRKDRVGWITALADWRIGNALRLLHGDVAHRWTVPMLASAVGMSRSAFTQRFNERVGRPPLTYLTHWRMVLAQQKLNAGLMVGEVAASVGYNSQTAFAHAFKRTLGRTQRSGSLSTARSVSAIDKQTGRSGQTELQSGVRDRL